LQPKQTPNANASTGAPSADRPTRVRVRVGRLWIDALTRETALEALESLVAGRRGGSIFTPNVDHIVTAETNAAFRRAYRRASLTFADGAPVVWASWFLRPPLPAKLSGSDMILPIARLAAARKWKVYLLGGGEGAAREAAARLRSEFNVDVVGTDDARVPMQADALVDAEVLERIRRAAPDLIFVGLGAPKQELWIDRMGRELSPAVAIGVGASIDFIAGRLRRSPALMSAIGLEWLYRLAQEPRRLWRRYLIQDPRFVKLVLRTKMLPRPQRVRVVPLTPQRVSGSTPVSLNRIERPTRHHVQSGVGSIRLSEKSHHA
jgi:N-acetylglucosaminyldiphosphoundecaprenol N-acetyl-beta-D-mannosaminyltransferase